MAVPAESLYETYFGLQERPFDLSADSRYLLLTPGHMEALCYLRLAGQARGGLALIIGEAGTGKTTLLKHATRERSNGGTRVHLIEAPATDRAELFAQIATAIDLGPATSRGELHQAVARRLQETPEGIGLFFDEAQGLSDELFEEIRLLSNVETAAGQRLALMLVGQPEIGQRLREPHLASFKQRVGARFFLQPLSLQETAAYIAARVAVAGGDAGQIFTADAVRAAYEASRGLPRVVNIICHNALIAGFGAQRRPVDPALVAEVCRDLDIAAPPVPPSHPVAAAPRPLPWSAPEAVASSRIEPLVPEAEPAAPAWHRSAIFEFDAEEPGPTLRTRLQALFRRSGGRRSAVGTET